MLFYFTPNPMESTAWFKVKLDNNFVVKRSEIQNVTGTKYTCIFIQVF